MKEDKRVSYSGQYRDVNYSAVKFSNPMKNSESSFDTAEESDFNWCHYIHLKIDKQIENEEIREKFWLDPKYDNRGRCSYHYYNSIINDIEFHGGCTWYSKESSVDEKYRSIKIGCDYQHLFDRGIEYSLNYIKGEIEKTIDSFLEITPVLKWCSGCGTYYKDVTKNGCGKCEYSKDKY